MEYTVNVQRAHLLVSHQSRIRQIMNSWALVGLVGRFDGWLVHWLNGCVVDWLVCWFVDWLCS